MERLTKKNDSGGYYYPKCFEKCNGLGANSECDDCEIMTSVCEKLGDYEDLDEQGRLIKLPCRIGIRYMSKWHHTVKRIMQKRKLKILYILFLVAFA